MSSTGNEVVLDVLVESKDLDRAVNFYKKAFDLEASKLTNDGWKLSFGHMSLCVCSFPSGKNSTYRKGEVPRLEFRVDDVDVYVNRCVKLGATVRCRLVKGQAAVENEPADYAQVLDPYGHVWSFTE